MLETPRTVPAGVLVLLGTTIGPVLTVGLARDHTDVLGSRLQTGNS